MFHEIFVYPGSKRVQLISILRYQFTRIITKHGIAAIE